jgi:LPXTG-site transpeptidase (sortase) family protein
MFVRLAATLAVAFALASSTASAAGGDLPPVLQTVRPARLVVPSIDVDAPIVELGLEPDGAMISPDGPNPVAWYSFSPTPGNPGNAVLAGHRDWHTGVVGVFWRLGELGQGAPLTVVLEDGTRLDYVVGLSALIGPDEVPIDDVVGQTRDEMITLITCEGGFDPRSREYDRRRVIRAGRVAP